MTTFASGFARTYADAWRFLTALPVLGLAIVGVEGLQHYVEWRAGMYVDRAAAVHAATDMGRMISGTAKVLWLNLVAFWVIRYAVSGSPSEAMRPGAVAVRGYAWVMAFSAALALVTLWPPVLAASGPMQRAISNTELVLQLATYPLGMALVPWIAGAALGDPRATIGFSLKRAWGSIWWSVALSLLTALPLLAVHYALNLGAIGKPAPVAILLLGVDAVFVGYVGVAGGAAQAVVARRMAERAGETLALAA